MRVFALLLLAIVPSLTAQDATPKASRSGPHNTVTACNESHPMAFVLCGLTDVFPIVTVNDRERGNDPDIPDLSIDQVRTDVELKLRLAGINPTPEGPATCQVNVHLIKYPRGFYFIVIALEVSQAGVPSASLERLVRSHKVTEQTVGDLLNRANIALLTWGGDLTVGFYPVGEVAATIRDKVKDKMDDFLNVWLAVNPRRPSP
jgi:hypothetical protein